MSINWNFERGVLAGTAVLVVACLGFTIWMSMKADDLEGRMNRSQSSLAEMGLTATETFSLMDELLKDGVASGEGPYAYLEKQQVESRIGRKFNTGTQRGDRQEGYHDDYYTLTAAQSEYDFTRQQIATFLLYIEANTARMKVTRIRLDQSNRRDATSDDWKATFTITDRQPVTEE
jgi:hypothetical protein